MEAHSDSIGAPSQSLHHIASRAIAPESVAIAPAGESSTAVDGAKDGAEGIGDQVGNGAGGQADLFCWCRADGVDVGVGGVLDHLRDFGQGIPHVVLSATTNSGGTQDYVWN